MWRTRSEPVEWNKKGIRNNEEKWKSTEEDWSNFIIIYTRKVCQEKNPVN